LEPNFGLCHTSHCVRCSGVYQSQDGLIISSGLLGEDLPQKVRQRQSPASQTSVDGILDGRSGGSVGDLGRRGVPLEKSTFREEYL
jgi:hypothetical protein